MIGNNSLTAMTSDELASQLINGHPGSRASREAILELIQRNKKMRVELRRMDVTGIWLDELWSDYIKTHDELVTPEDYVAEKIKYRLTPFNATINFISAISIFFSSGMLYGLLTYNQSSEFTVAIAAVLLSFMTTGIVSIASRRSRRTTKIFLIIIPIMLGFVIPSAGILLSNMNIVEGIS